MPRFRCPRCSTIVTAVAGAAPLCPSCGFGSAAPTAAPALATPPAAPPVPAAPPPVAPMAWASPVPATAPLAMAPAVPPRRGNGGKVAVLVAVGLLVVAGLGAAAWFLLGMGGGLGGGGDDLTQAEAEERVATSLAAAGAALTGEGEPGSLREVTMSMQPPTAAEGEMFGAGDMEFTITYGRDDVVRIEISVVSGPATIALTLICTPDQTFVLYGGDAYGSRESVEPSEESCSEGGGMFGAPAGLDDEMPEDESSDDMPFPTFEDLEAEDADITVHDDGSITAVVVDEESEATFEIDEDGRVVRITIEGRGESAGMEGVIDFAYGSRPTIDLPEDYALIPANVETERADDGAVTTWTVTASPHEPPLAELEVRVQEFSFGFPDPEATPLATFALTAGEQADGNFTFRFTDADGDGRLTAGDTYVLTDLEQQAADAAEAEEDDGSSGFDFDFDFPSHDAVLYDLEADGAVNSGPSALMPSPLWLVLAGLAIAVLALRRVR